MKDLAELLSASPKQPNREIPKTVEYAPAQHCLQTLEEAAPVIILSDQNSLKAFTSRTGTAIPMFYMT